MEQQLKETIDLMVVNFHTLKENFKSDSSLIKHFGAMLHANKKQNINVALVSQIKSIIKDSTGWGSYFRGDNAFLLSNLLCFEQDYKEMFQSIVKVHDFMKASSFKSSLELPLAAYTITKYTPNEQWDFRIKRMQAFYGKMKQNHCWLTSTDDYIFASMLAITELDPDIATERMEHCYSLLHSMGLRKGNNLQALSQILALNENAEKYLCPRVIKIHGDLRCHKLKFDYFGLACLGILANLNVDADKLVDSIVSVYNYLYTQKGYGFWSMDKSTRAVLSVTLVADFYVTEAEKGFLQLALANSIISMVLSHDSSADIQSSSGTGADF